VDLTVAQANELFAADFSTFQNVATNQTVVRTLSYSIPSALKSQINWVHPTVKFVIDFSRPKCLRLTCLPIAASLWGRGPYSLPAHPGIPQVQLQLGQFLRTVVKAHNGHLLVFSNFTGYPQRRRNPPQTH
jgi:hypothetical protein